MHAPKQLTLSSTMLTPQSLSHEMSLEALHFTNSSSTSEIKLNELATANDRSSEKKICITQNVAYVCYKTITTVQIIYQNYSKHLIT